MITLQRHGLRIEAAAVPEADGACCVTAEVFDGGRMIRGHYRRVPMPANGYPQAEREFAEDVACMSSEAE